MTFDVEAGARAILRHLGMPHALTWDAQILAEAPDTRMVVEYVFADGGGPMGARQPSRVVGKFYADDTGARTAEIMQEVAAALAGLPGGDVLALPRALFYDPACRFLAQEHLAVPPLNSRLDAADYPRYFALVGRALARFHRLNVPAGPTARLEGHLHDLIHPHPLELSRWLPGARPPVEGLLAELLRREHASWSDALAVPVHRDVHVRQLFADDGRVWLIDWDLAARGDAALDVGNFLVYLRTHLGALAPRAADAFLDGYVINGPSTTLDRVPTYAAFTYLRLACKRVRLGRAGWQQQAMDLLRQAERCLTEGSSDVAA